MELRMMQLIKIVEYLRPNCGQYISLTADKYHFVDENGAMLSPVCFEINSIDSDNDVF
jgi:hypothetical protein